MFELWGLTFHLYGFIIGVSVLIAWFLIERKARENVVSREVLENRVLLVIISGLLGARLYHVITDWYVYQHQVEDILKVWQGGLSIIGAVMGGLLGLSISSFFFKDKVSVKTFLDLCVFGVPLAQVVGRLGNWVNQELYGWPTTLPWGVFIDERHRLPGFENFTHFHPLFAYEMIAMTVFGCGVWIYDRWLTIKHQRLIGSGVYFLLYTVYYASIRFLLDFLRPDKALTAGGSLGINQAFLLAWLITAFVWWLWQTWLYRYEKS